MSTIVFVELTEAERQALSRIPALEVMLARMAQQVEQKQGKCLNPKDKLSPKKVGELCGCKAEVVRKAVVMGKLVAYPVLKTRGGKAGIVVMRDDAEAWLKKGRPIS